MVANYRICSCSSLTPIRTVLPHGYIVQNYWHYIRHVKRVFGYARSSDYAVAGGLAAASPLSFWVMERASPSHVGRGGFSPVMRLATAIGLVGGLHILYQRSCSMSISLAPSRLGGCSTNNNTDRFYGFTENSREVEMDSREMVDKVKKGEPLYGTSKVSTYLQGVAARNSRYSQLFVHVLPWFNAVNHDQVSHFAAISFEHGAN